MTQAHAFHYIYNQIQPTINIFRGSLNGQLVNIVFIFYAQQSANEHK